jgi:hypothetical protein
MVPEEWRTSAGIGANAVEKMRHILIHAVVNHDRFVLGLLAGALVLICA